MINFRHTVYHRSSIMTCFTDSNLKTIKKVAHFQTESVRLFYGLSLSTTVTKDLRC